MKRTFVALLGVMLAMVVVVAACGKPATTTQAKAASTTGTKATGAATVKQYPSAPKMTIDKNKKHTVTLHTSKGDIGVELFASEAPITVNNFVFLAKDGFYNGVKFHRVIKGFMIQGGDPKGDGTGGPGYNIPDEPVTRKYLRGTIAMANTGRPNTGGGQFFIMHQDYPLPPQYTIFGIVTKGIEVVDAIATTPTVMGADGAASRPTQDILISSVDVAVQ